MEIQKSKILIVDDNEITLKLIKRYLESDEFEVLTAGDGEDCLKLVKEHIPDIILLDVMMPKLDGYDTIKILKSANETKNIPVIIVTALNDVVNQVKSIQSGADDFISKPIEEKLLLSKIRLFTELAKERRKNRQLIELLEKAKEMGFDPENDFTD